MEDRTRERGGGVGTRPARRPFVVGAATLRKVPGTSRHELRSGEIEGLASLGVAVPEGTEATADLELTSYAGGIDAVGTVRAAWEGECRRCGGPVVGEVVAEVRERFVPGGGAGADAAPDPSGNGEDDAYPFDGDELDLEPLVRDAVLLGLPLAPLCDPACLGLCPACGVDRNVESCACPPPSDPRWAALDVLRDPTDPD